MSTQPTRTGAGPAPTAIDWQPLQHFAVGIRQPAGRPAWPHTAPSSTIVWKRVADELPDVDTNVLLGLADGFSCEGFLDDDIWRDVCAEALDDGAVVYWAELPRVEVGQ